jgi:hypothetical protein
MAASHDTSASSTARTRRSRLLKAGLTFAALVGAVLVVWLLDKAIRFPEIQARQFGRFGDRVPLWIPFLLFVVASFAGICYVIWRAKQRVDTGEDLYAQRHRKRPGDPGFEGLLKREEMSADEPTDALEEAPEEAPGSTQR